MNLLALFFAGAFACNALPHLVAGLQGQPFPTPFARFRGAIDSSPLLNFVWGFANTLIAALLWSPRRPALGLNAGCVALLAGALLLGIGLALHFGRLRRGGGR